MLRNFAYSNCTFAEVKATLRAQTFCETFYLVCLSAFTSHLQSGISIGAIVHSTGVNDNTEELTKHNPRIQFLNGARFTFLSTPKTLDAIARQASRQFSSVATVTPCSMHILFKPFRSVFLPTAFVSELRDIGDT